MLNKLARRICQYTGVKMRYLTHQYGRGPIPPEVSQSRAYYLYFAKGMGFKLKEACKVIKVNPQNASYYVNKWCDGWDGLTAKERREILKHLNND